MKCALIIIAIATAMGCVTDGSRTVGARGGLVDDETAALAPSARGARADVGVGGPMD
jgi:hypothetical protein